MSIESLQERIKEIQDNEGVVSVRLFPCSISDQNIIAAGVLKLMDAPVTQDNELF
jgi:deoxycytidylate deaminase